MARHHKPRARPAKDAWKAAALDLADRAACGDAKAQAELYRRLEARPRRTRKGTK